MDASERFGENLLRIRQARKLSQENLAERAGIHRTQISLLESGRRQPLLETVVRLAGALDVPVDDPVRGDPLGARRPVGHGEFVVTTRPSCRG